MASIAESSVGSLPLAQLAQLQDQILRGQGRVRPEANAGRDVGQRHDDGTTDATIEDNTATDDARTAYRTPISSPKLNVPSRLEAMEAMVQPSPSQEAFEKMTRASSFHRFEGGDTQPLESQVYRNFDESIRQPRETPKREKVVLQISPEGKVEYSVGAPRTLREGDEGYVNLELEDGWLGHTQGSEASGFEELWNAKSQEEQEQAQAEDDDLFRKPAMPQTPSLAGKKRRRSGEVLTSGTSAKKTPGFSQVFGFKAQKGDMMTGTQLFEQTQARSSPLPDGLRSDPAITRPSPNMQSNLPISSPTTMASSPIYSRPPPATAGEPRETYTSVLESQERKRARFEEALALSRQKGDDFDEDEDTERRRFENQRMRRTLSDQALHSLKSIGLRGRDAGVGRPATATAMSSSSPRKEGVIDLRTPGTVKKIEGFDFEVSDDGQEDGEEMNGVEVENGDGGWDDEQLPEGNGLGVGDAGMDDTVDDDQQSENDEYDELGQTVLRSQGPGPHDDEEVEEVAHEDDEVGDAPKKAATEQDEEGQQRTLVQGSSQQATSIFQRRSQTATQHSAIADSQPFRNQRQSGSASCPHNTGSPSCSYVPGSQYAGRTSQEQASLPVKQPSGSMGPPTSKSQENEQVVPSSPPLDTANSKSLDFTGEAPLQRRKMLARFQLDQQPDDTTMEREIPESDLPAPSSRPATATASDDRPNTENNPAPFSAARSHLSTNAPSRSQDAPPPDVSASQTPRSKAGVRKFAEIVGLAMSPQGSGETQKDIAEVVEGLVGGETEFWGAVSSPVQERPAKKRRKGAEVVSPRHLEGGAVPEALTATEEPAAHEESDEVETRALRNSPSKANEQRAVSPPTQSTPESVKLREQAGAQAASQLLSKRSTRTAKPAKLSSAKHSKRASKLHRETTVDSNEVTPKAKEKRKRVSSAKKARALATDTTQPAPLANAMVEPEFEETIVEAHDDVAAPEQGKQSSETAAVAPHRVFAFFKGAYNMFYPATWMRTSPVGGGHRIKFDDGTETTLEPHFVCRLELSLGDQVKVDFPGMKNKVYIVKGFGPALPADRAFSALTDVHGHETVKVQAKSTRNSVSGPHAVAQGDGEVVEVALEVIYLTHSMWVNFSKRVFRPAAAAGQAIASRLATPSTGVQTPVDAGTPASRSRRAATSTAKPIEKQGSIICDDPATASRTPSAGLFHGMAFAVSYGQNEAEKIHVTRLLQRHGGRILEDGFESLFDAPNLGDGSAASPGLRLKDQHKPLGFVALIADKHSRRAKYIQALALGLPTLSGRWVTDSLAATNASAAPLPWSTYLLAAGESSYLSGAIRSRSILPYDATAARLEDIIAARPKLLNGDGVLIVAAKKSKVVWERRKAFAFLTLALGAGEVRRVNDLQGARGLLEREQGTWAFVYVDGSVGEAGGVVFGKKRKREEGGGKGGDGKMCVVGAEGRVRVVCDEFVVQSLILGGLVG